MGSYVQSNLLKDEQVVYETNLHWIKFVSFRGLFTLFIASLIDRLCSEFAITNRRVIAKTGFVKRHTVEINLDKVEALKVEQGVWGRMLNFGTIFISGAGTSVAPIREKR